MSQKVSPTILRQVEAFDHVQFVPKNPKWAKKKSFWMWTVGLKQEIGWTTAVIQTLQMIRFFFCHSSTVQSQCSLCALHPQCCFLSLTPDFGRFFFFFFSFLLWCQPGTSASYTDIFFGVMKGLTELVVFEIVKPASQPRFKSPGITFLAALLEHQLVVMTTSSLLTSMWI